MMGSAAAAVVRKGLLYLHLSTVYVPEEFRRGVGITLPPPYPNTSGYWRRKCSSDNDTHSIGLSQPVVESGWAN